MPFEGWIAFVALLISTLGAVGSGTWFIAHKLFELALMIQKVEFRLSDVENKIAFPIFEAKPSARLKAKRSR